MANGILHFRVDDRMIHGIVATDWVPAYNATRAMVIDGPASTNDIVRSGLKMACPAGVALSVLAPEKAVENIKAGVEIPQLNLGNVTQNKGETTTLDKTVRVSDEELAMLREMAAAGVKITARFRFSDNETELNGKLN